MAESEYVEMATVARLPKNNDIHKCKKNWDNSLGFEPTLE